MNLNNPKRVSFKENRLENDVRFSTYENILNFLNQSRHVWNAM